MLNQKQLVIMLNMQNELNKTVDYEWVTKGWDYMRAVALEAAEAIEHHGWKWWKAQKMNHSQLQMELIDIWHFYLSSYLQIHGGNEQKALKHIIKDINEIDGSVIFDGQNYIFDKMSMLEKLDLLCGLACAKRMSIGLFFALCNDIKLTTQNIYEQYVQKNILNIFRQSKGYKKGNYYKEWFGEEDNHHLMKIASQLNSSDENYIEKLWGGLEEIYNKVLKQNNRI